MKKLVSARRRLRKTTPAITGFEGRRGPQDKECGQLLQNWKIQETDFPLDPPERNAALPVPGF